MEFLHTGVSVIMLINIITDTPVCKNSIYGMLYIVLATACKNAGILPPTYIHITHTQSLRVASELDVQL